MARAQFWRTLFSLLSTLLVLVSVVYTISGIFIHVFRFWSSLIFKCI